MMHLSLGLDPLKCVEHPQPAICKGKFDAVGLPYAFTEKGLASGLHIGFRVSDLGFRVSGLGFRLEPQGVQEPKPS